MFKVNSPSWNTAVNVLIGMCAFPVVLMLGPWVEMTYFPVATNTRITQHYRDDDGNTVIFGDSRKTRNCNYDHLDWYYGDIDGVSVRAKLDIMEGAVLRTAGGFSFGPWKVRMSESQFLNSYAIVYHYCHPFWLSKSKFYP